MSIEINPDDAETAYFLTTFMNRQRIDPKLEALCSRGTVTVSGRPDLTLDSLQPVVDAFAAEMDDKFSEPDQIAAAKALAANFRDYADECGE